MSELRPEIKDGLLRRAAAEQALREEWGDSDNEELRLKVLAEDTKNTAYLKELIEHMGWPKISEVCQDVAMAAWLIAQHSPDDDFRKHCLELMLENPDEVEPRKIARTIDRVRIHDGRRQYYGTHFAKSDDGTWVPLPIEDAEHVDERRAMYGLEPLTEKVKEYNAEA